MRWPPPSDWPNVALSRQVLCRPHRWHVQETGHGDTLLLLHGAGGSTHSFRDLIPLLSTKYHVVAIDLPGQGFTQLGARHRCGLEPMSEDVAALCKQEGWTPAAIIGHSAGAALALRLSQRLLSPRGQAPDVVGINAALDNFEGLAGVLFPVLAKMLAAVPFTAQIFSAASGNPARVKSLIRGTGSELDSEGLQLYGRLVGNRDHADATLMMMANWSLADLLRDLPQITARVLLIAAEKDKAVPPQVSVRAAERIPGARLIRMPAVGHLAHEEAPEEVAGLILTFLADQSLS